MRIPKSTYTFRELAEFTGKGDWGEEEIPVALIQDGSGKMMGV